MSWDSIAMVDWSGGRDTGAKPRKDAIWAALIRGGEEQAPVYLRTRRAAEDWLGDLIETEVAAGRRLLIGFDFPFGYPQGFARAVTGADDPLGLWDWLEARIEDAPDGTSNRFDLAGEINRMFPGTGPFWGNGLPQRDIPDLPRKGRAAIGHGVRGKREAERRARGAFTLWQLAGAGAVGSQALTGLPVLARLRRRFAGQVAVWPFEAPVAPVAFVEVWPSLIAGTIRETMPEGEIRDRHQVRVLARAVAMLEDEALGAMLDVSQPEEGWILGLGHEEALAEAAGRWGSARESAPRGEAPGADRPEPAPVATPPEPKPEPDDHAATVPLAPPPLRDDCFAMPRGAHWTPVDEALATLRDRLTCIVPLEEVPLGEAAGRILAADVTARRSHPPAANAAVDGYGFAHASVAPGEVRLPLLAGRAAAGAPYPGGVPPGTALRILTGAALPEGVDTVVLEEDCATDGTTVAFRGPPKRGANTRRAGEDLAEGDASLASGRVLMPADLGLLAATGHGNVPVRRRLRVAILSTGDELREPGEPAGPGAFHDANRPMLAATLARWGMEVVDLGIAGDTPRAVRAALDRGAVEADAILTSGGASAGDEDHVSRLLREAGALSVWRIAVKPGRPLALGMWDGVPVFGLPGNPVAAFVCTLVFARPALLALAGAGWRAPAGLTVPAAFKKSKKAGRREYLRARLRDGRAEVFASEGSGRVSGLSWAEGLVDLGDPAREVSEGDPVTFLPYGSFGL